MKEEKKKREGGETEDPALWDSGVCFGGGQRGFVCRSSPDTDWRDAVSCSLCVCSETRPTSDPCTTHTPPSAAQEAAVCFLWTEPLPIVCDTSDSWGSGVTGCDVENVGLNFPK